jgi:hypothetical protein
MTDQSRFDEIARHTSPALLDQLRQLGQHYGPLGVALAAARLTDQDVLVERITASQENRCPSSEAMCPDLHVLTDDGTCPHGCDYAKDGDRHHPHRYPTSWMPDLVADHQRPDTVTMPGGWCAPTEAIYDGLPVASMPSNLIGPHEFQRISWWHRRKCTRCYWPKDSHPIRAHVTTRRDGDTTGFVTAP